MMDKKKSTGQSSDKQEREPGIVTVYKKLGVLRTVRRTSVRPHDSIFTNEPPLSEEDIETYKFLW